MTIFLEIVLFLYSRISAINNIKLYAALALDIASRCLVRSEPASRVLRGAHFFESEHWWLTMANWFLAVACFSESVVHDIYLILFMQYTVKHKL
jgi:membrane-associated PAP2 superfamily phosphatase